MRNKGLITLEGVLDPNRGNPGVYMICLCPSVGLSVRPSIRPSVRHANHTTLCPRHFGMKPLS